MNQPEIQYCTTSDGVSIAYATEGDGQPLVVIPSHPIAHVQRAPEMFPSSFQLPGTVRRIRYDSRGTGLSDRDALDFSMEAMMRDLDAVVERTGLQSFAVQALGSSVPIAVTYAATFPDRVSHLILTDGWASWSDLAGMPVWETFEALIDKDWVMFTETVARVLTGMDDPQVVEGLGEYIRGCIEPEAYRAFSLARKNWNVVGLLPNLTAQTLVLHNNESRTAPIRAGQKLAASIPHARFLAIDDVNYQNVQHLVEFLGIATVESTAPSSFPSGTATQTGLTVILFADIANSTGLTEQLGDAAFREKARALDTALREAITSAGGTAIEGKLLGDGVLATFGAARDAIACAQAMHRLSGGAAGSSDQPPSTSDLLLHVGIHAGDVIREDNNVFGGAVNVAARISDASKAGETLVSGTVRDLARTSAGVSFVDRGDRDLKGVSDPVRVWSVVHAATPKT